MPRAIPALLAALLLAAAQPCLALSSDRDQPMELEADHANIDDQRGVHVYTGNVIITQGTMRITADHLTVKLRDGDIVEAIALGQPATYRQRPDGKEQDVEAKSLRMEYYADKGELILIDQARVWQGRDTFSSQRIHYDIDQDIVNAGDGQNRVKIILQPKPKAQP